MHSDKKTVVIGASTNPERASYDAVQQLNAKNYPIVAVGLKEGKIGEVDIQKGFPKIENVDTITLYVGAKNQPVYYNYIFSLNPKRIIFNPGAENYELVKLAAAKGIETIEACTLTMLAIGNY